LTIAAETILFLIHIMDTPAIVHDTGFIRTMAKVKRVPQFMYSFFGYSAKKCVVRRNQPLP
jgi:hypothetical protein